MWNMLIDIVDWQYPILRYLLWCRAFDTMSGSLHMSFGRSWTGVEILIDEFLAHVGASVEESASHRLEEGRYLWVAQ